MDIEAFVHTCRSDARRAAKILGQTELDICLAIERLQCSVPVDLFINPLKLSKDTLTDDGKKYLKYAEASLDNLQQGVLEVLKNHEGASERVAKVKIGMCASIGKEILARSLLSLAQKVDPSEVCVDLVTFDDIVGECPLKYHVIFGDAAAVREKFFKTKWSAVITQGLYASENYVEDVGVPQSVQDLVNHSVIMCGNSFHDVRETNSNWYLSENYKFPEIKPAMVVNSLTAIFSAINADLGIGSSFCHRSRHLRRVLPKIIGPICVMNFAVRDDIPGRLVDYVDLLSDATRNELQAAEIKLITTTEESYV